MTNNFYLWATILSMANIIIFLVYWGLSLYDRATKAEKQLTNKDGQIKAINEQQKWVRTQLKLISDELLVTKKIISDTLLVNPAAATPVLPPQEPTNSKTYVKTNRNTGSNPMISARLRGEEALKKRLGIILPTAKGEVDG